MDLTKMFDDLRKQEQKSLDDTQTTFTPDTDLIYFKVGTYEFRFRLIFAVPPKSKRRTPFIFQQTHRYWDEDAKESYKVICPTSEYLEGKQAYFNKSCKACQMASKYYKDHESTGSSISKEMYQTFKRQFNGYAMVYVIKDPVNPDNDGTFKIMRFGWNIYKFLKREVLGTDVDKKEDITTAEDFNEEEFIGINAFKLDAGYDLIINTSKKTDKYNEYSCKFSRKPTKVKVTEKEATLAAQELEFDEKYFLDYDKDEINAFVNRIVECEEKEEEKEEYNEPELGEETSDEEDVPDSLQEVEEPEEETSDSSDDLDDADLDSILAGI